MSYDKIHKCYHFDVDLEIEVKTTVDDIFCSAYEGPLQAKALPNEVREEFELSFGNRYIACGTRYSQAVSHSCENPMKEDVLYDDIDCMSISTVEGSLKTRFR